MAGQPKRFKKKEFENYVLDYFADIYEQQTQDGTDLSRLVCNIKGSLGHRIALIEALKVYPVLNVRIAKTLF